MSLNSRLSLVMVLVAVFGCKAGKGGGSGEIDRTCTRSAAPLLLNDCANGGHQATKDQQASPPCDAAPDLICGGRGECNWETLTCDGRKADFECVRPSKEGERCITDCDCSVNFFCDDQSAVCVAYAPQQDHRGVRFTWPPCDDSVYKPGDAVTIDYDFSYCGPRPGQTATNDLAWIPWNLAVVQCDNNPRGIFSTVDGEGNTIGSAYFDGTSRFKAITTLNEEEGFSAQYLIAPLPAAQMSRHCQIYVWRGSQSQKEGGGMVSLTGMVFIDTEAGKSKFDFSTLPTPPAVVKPKK